MSSKLVATIAKAIHASPHHGMPYEDCELVAKDVAKAIDAERVDMEVLVGILKELPKQSQKAFRRVVGGKLYRIACEIRNDPDYKALQVVEGLIAEEEKRLEALEMEQQQTKG
jgi:hypothetical protein